MPFFKRFEETTLWYEDSGGDGLPVVLAHGFLMDHRTFDGQVEGIPDLRWIRWDLRGHGATQSSSVEYSFWDQARDALALLDYLGVDKAIFGGHSQGGYVAMRMALLAPARSVGLLLFSTSDEPYEAEMREGYRRFFSDWRPGDDDTLAVTASLATTMIGGPRELQLLWRERWAEKSNEDLGPAVDCLVEVDNITELTPSLGLPALVTHGAAEQAFTRRAVDDLGQRLAGRVVSFESAPHGLHMSHSNEVNELIREWIASEVSSPRPERA